MLADLTGKEEKGGRGKNEDKKHLQPTDNRARKQALMVRVKFFQYPERKSLRVSQDAKLL